MTQSDLIAIVGLAGRFPGAGADLDRFWANVAGGVDCSSEVPVGRWTIPPDRCHRPGGPFSDSVASTRGYFLDPFKPNLDGLDVPSEFVGDLDPLFHLVLDVGGRAWRTAKTGPVDKRKVGVVLGNICLPTDRSNDLCREYLGGPFADVLPKTPKTHPLNRYVAGLPAGILAKALGLGLGTFTLDAACATSLYAIKLAADELTSGRADAMLAGGCSRPDALYTQMGFSQLTALSPTGRCSPFDSAADGLVVGEGAGIFVLKRLPDAVAHGDTIHAVFHAAGLSNDLAGSLLAPAAEGQLRAMRAAYKKAGWVPADVDLVECHATGTPVGDAVEFDSLRELWGPTGWLPGRCAIGSVKSTVGHLLTGAGAAAVMKVVFALKNKTLPPQANFRTPAAGLAYDGGPFRVLTAAEPWAERRTGRPRRAAVSGFGFGGVNAHLLFEEFSAPVHSNVKSAAKPGAAEPIAVVGLGAKVGPWGNLRTFQEYVLGGGTTHAPAAKVNGWGNVPTPHAPGHFLESLDVPLTKYRVPPKELEDALPQQLLALEICAAAIDDSAAPPAQPDPATGVFVGVTLDPNTTNFHLRWAVANADPARSDAASPPLTADRTMGALASIAASRVARVFQFGGPSFTVCSEESSSGRALELAVRALRAGEIDRAVVCGVDLAGDPRAVRAAGGWSADGAAAPFARDASGAVPADGAAAVVLKRLADAERSGDRVYAVVRGIGSAVGGSATGTGPDAAAVASSFVRACTDGAVDPGTVDYVDAAAAGSPAGDAAEAEAIAAVLKNTDRSFPLAIGAVRGQVGHAGAASAALGFVKACLAVYHELLPPSAVAADRAREELARVTPRCHFPTAPRYWLADRGRPRRAVVAAAGVDGSATHAVFEEYAGNAPTPVEVRSKVTVERRQPLGASAEAVFAVEADIPTELIARLDVLANHADPAKGIERLAREWLAAAKPDPRARRAVTIIARTAGELRELAEFARTSLRSSPDRPIPDPNRPLNPTVRDRVFFTPQPTGKGKLAFVYPGSGNHFAGMGRDLGTRFPEVLRRQEAENESLRSQYAPDRFWADAIPDETTAKQYLFGQVTLGTLTSDLLTALGIKPDAVIGLSLGESASLFGVRAWKGRDEMYRRIQSSSLFGPDLGPPYQAARTYWGLDPLAPPVEWQVGVLAAGPDDVRCKLRPGLKAYLLIVNTPRECVIGGIREDVAELARVCGGSFVPLSGVTLAHCEVGKAVEGPYRALHTLPTTAPPGVRVYSGAWARAYTANEANAAESITAGLLHTIDVPAVIEAAYKDGLRVFVEVGPGSSCCRMIDAVLGNRPHLARAVTGPRQDAPGLVLRLVAALIAERAVVDLGALYGKETRCVGHGDPPAAGRTLSVPVGLPPAALPPVGPVATPIPVMPGSHVFGQAETVRAVPARVGASVVDLFLPPGQDPTVIERPSEVLAAAGPEPVEVMATAADETPRPAGLTPAVIPAPVNRLVAVDPYIRAAAAAQESVAVAHAQFLRVQGAFTSLTATALGVHSELIRRAAGSEPDVFTPGSPGRGPTPPTRTDVPRTLDTAACFAFARGKIGDVLGPMFATVDGHPTRVRLPDGPLMLVDRILSIEGEPKSLTAGRVVTEHTVHGERWYLDSGRCPTSVTVEAGQADLFLSGFLGIDFETKGLAVYRLLDAVVTFHRGLPVVGETIRYDIRIDEFFHQAGAWLFRFRFEGTVNGEPLLSMRNGVAGFFTAEALAAGQGIIHTKLDLTPIPGKKPADWNDLAPAEKTALGATEVEALRRGALAAAFGPAFADLPIKPEPLPGGMLRLVDRVPVIDPAGGRFGIGFVRAEYDVHPDDWFLTCHFVDDMVMPGTLMYECCLHTLRILLMRLGWVGGAGRVVHEPVPGVQSRLKCRGQVVPSTKTVAYEVSVKELGYGPEPFCIADALMYADGKPIVEITNMSLRMTGVTRLASNVLFTTRTKSSPTPTASRPRRSASRTAYSIRTASSPACRGRPTSSSIGSRPWRASRSS